MELRRKWGGWATWTLLVLPLSMWIGVLPVAALCLGYASHLAGDACTCTGIPLLYPRRESFHLLPVKLRVVTGTAFEELIFVLFALLDVCLLMAQLTAFGR